MDKINLNKIKQDKDFIEKFGLQLKDKFTLLGQGEYNINYTFYSRTYNKKLVLRLATASQMNLKDQIRYEYEALKLLAKTGRTPKALYLDDRKKLIPYGFLVMDYLPGRHLNYKKDLHLAARILADIHNQPLPKAHHLLTPKNPIEAIYKECIEMFERYKDSRYMDMEIKSKIEKMLEKGKNISSKDIGNRTIINTELNSGNFLINEGEENNYLVDWEKPLGGYSAQDLGHFLAPTTTFWKTDTVLSQSQISFFIKEYCKNSKGYKDEKELFDSVKNYIAINCLRGITWCSMAYVDYQAPDKLILNQDTYKKIKIYLSKGFLKMIDGDYLNEY